MQPDLLRFQRQFAAALDAPATGAMAAYRNTVIQGAVEALRANYPVVEQIVGSEMFEQVAGDFVADCPPRRPVLALYGERFAEWLERQAWAADLPYVADVARVERLRLECLMAADAGSMSAQEVRGACTRPGVGLTLHPSVRFAWLSTPAMSIWLAHQRPFHSDLRPEWKAEGALFVRPEPFLLHAPRIGRAAHRILSGIRLGECPGYSIDTAARLYPGEDCPAVFASLVNMGVFAALSKEGNGS